MIGAIVRATVRTRLMLVATTIFCGLFMRVAYAFADSGRAWHLSELHETSTLVLLGLVLPTFAALLGAMLLRGEHAPWTWALARPVGRARLLAVIAAVDATTIAACVGMTALVFEGLGETALGFPIAALAGSYTMVYLAAAIGGARGMPSLRGATFGLLWLAGLGVLTHVMLLAARLPTLELPVSAAVVAIGVVVPFLRAARTVPSVPRWRSLLAPPLVAFVVCTVLALVLPTSV